MPELPRFDHLLDDYEGIAMMPASEVRRRGERRRTRRRAAAAVGACALVAAVGFGIAQSPWLRADGGRAVPATPSPSVTVSSAPSVEPSHEPSQSMAPSPTTSDSPSGAGTPAGTTLSFDLLPTGEEMGAEGFPSKVMEEFEGAGQAGRDMCDPGVWGSPTQILTRTYGTDGYPASQQATVLQYASADEARVGFDDLRGGYALCPQRIDGTNGLREVGFLDRSGELPIYVNAIDADPTNVVYGNFGGLIEGSDEGHFGQVVIAQLGDRVLWVSEDIVGMDANCGIEPDDGSGEEQCAIPRSAQRWLERVAEGR